MDFVSLPTEATIILPAKRGDMDIYLPGVYIDPGSGIISCMAFLMYESAMRPGYGFRPSKLIGEQFIETNLGGHWQKAISLPDGLELVWESGTDVLAPGNFIAGTIQLMTEVSAPCHIQFRWSQCYLDRVIALRGVKVGIRLLTGS